MHLRQLEYIDMIVKHGTMREAAQQLFVTEPTISQQVREFEKEIGFQIFERSGRNIKLTKQGEKVLPTIRNVLLSVKDLENHIIEINDPSTGQIQLGIGPLTASRYLPELFQKFNILYPKVKLNVVQGGLFELTRLLIDNQLDVVVAPVNPSTKELMELNHFECITLFHDEYIAIVSKNHPFSSRTEISIHEISNEQLILYRTGILREYILSIFGEEFKENIIFSTDNNESTLALVRLGVGISIIPKFYTESWSEKDKEGISFVTFHDIAVKSDPCCFYSKKRYAPQYLKKFIEILIEITKK
ncbi:hypothetical protein DCC39_18205 [Pueribacillus theae]|uniref:HTH lysR-type domain-containing protein n=1 Tax=Pueribacillus theae TaxID=2171751 RepID=A0A2U1JJH3_9BACI|nr:LysR family transcriptional regulator [Pueribacillus theae]PWA05287.1 hypothetical protein DCC39_18205 [Pueribacillus theae]